jgi:hypothetical protein
MFVFEMLVQIAGIARLTADHFETLPALRFIDIDIIQVFIIY